MSHFHARAKKKKKTLSSHCRIGNILCNDTQKHCISYLRITTQISLLFTKVINNMISITVLSVFSNNNKKASHLYFFLVFMSQLHIRKGVIKIIWTHAVLAGSYLYTTCIFTNIKMFCLYNCIFLLSLFAINQLKGATVFIIPSKMGYFPSECKIHGSFAGKL